MTVIRLDTLPLGRMYAQSVQAPMRYVAPEAYAASGRCEVALLPPRAVRTTSAARAKPLSQAQAPRDRHGHAAVAQPHRSDECVQHHISAARPRGREARRHRTRLGPLTSFTGTTSSTLHVHLNSKTTVGVLADDGRICDRRSQRIAIP